MAPEVCPDLTPIRALLLALVVVGTFGLVGIALLLLRVRELSQRIRESEARFITEMHGAIDGVERRARASEAYLRRGSARDH